MAALLSKDLETSFLTHPVTHLYSFLLIPKTHNSKKSFYCPSFFRRYRKETFFQGIFISVISFGPGKDKGMPIHSPPHPIITAGKFFPK